MTSLHLTTMNSSQLITHKWEFDDFSNKSFIDKEFSHPTNPSIQFYIRVFPNGYLNYLPEYTLIYLAFNKSDKDNDEVHFRLSILGNKKNIVQGKNFGLCVILSNN